MDINHYKEQLPHLVELTNEASDKLISFYQHILLVSVSILGILISLHSNSSPILYVRLIYIASVALFVFGILTTAVTLYDYTNLAERSRQSFRIEVQNALKEDREIELVTTALKRRTIFCKKASCVSLIAALLLISIYSCLSSLFS